MAPPSAARAVPVNRLIPGKANSLWIMPALALFIAALGALSLTYHYDLPPPVSAGEADQAEGLGMPAIFSEEAAMDVMAKLSLDIGYRIVGTQQHVEAEHWLESIVKPLEGWHQTGQGEGNGTQVEVFTQIGNGTHRFDFMHAHVFKRYINMSNVIVRLSDGTDEGKEHALLVNSHLDSTLPSPGAADDGMGVAIMLELLRIYTSPPRPRLRHAVILLFNNGEESLQDASHLYITQHETAKSVKAVVNLEAAGVHSPELLFQASSTALIDAYQQVPYPSGTVMANDVFGSGLILSDTDARQFAQYGNVPILDMAVIGGSYLYHTRKDVPAYIQPGVAQHFGENVISIVDFLATSPKSQLATAHDFPKNAPPIYFTIWGKYFFNISNKAWRGISLGISAMANFLLSATIRSESHFRALHATSVAIAGVVLAIAAGIISSNLVALLMTQGLNRNLSWFSGEIYPVYLYGPPALVGSLSVQYLLASLTKPALRPYMERAVFNGMLIVYCAALLILNVFGIGSAYLAGLGAGTALFAIIFNDFIMIGLDPIEAKTVPINHRVHWLTLFVLSIVPTIFGAEGMFTFLDVFVPLTGRTGPAEVAPSDHIIATIVAALCSLAFPVVSPLAHRFGLKYLGRAIFLLCALSVVMISVFAQMHPFGPYTPKRLFVHGVQNITDGTLKMHLGSADAAPGMMQLVDSIRNEMAPDAPAAVLDVMSDSHTAFDILYPVSAFLTPFSFSLPTLTTEEVSAWDGFVVQAKDEELDLEAGTRRITLEYLKPQGRVIWSVMAFDAEILEWDLGTIPVPEGHKRHVIKEVGRAGVDRWSLTMLLRLDATAIEAARKRGVDKQTHTELLKLAPGEGVPEAQRDPSRLVVSFSGLDAEVAARRELTPALNKMDGYLLTERPDVDAMLLSVIAGVSQC